MAGASGGGAVSVDLNALVPVLTQLTSVLTQLVSIVSSLAQAQAGAVGVQPQAGQPQVAGESGGGVGTAPTADPGTATDPGAVSGGGDAGSVAQASSCGCGCSGSAVAQAAATVVQQDAGPSQVESAKGDPGAPAKESSKATMGGKLDSGGLTVKGAKMTAEQKRLTEIVLKKGVEMGANKKVLETAVATMIQESEIHNDKSVDGKDHDSLGLFQQRPSAGWGTRKEISDPEYAAKKFFEKAIPNDKKHPDWARTRLAQSVQVSAFPNAYAKWDKEAEKIVADYMG